jgi:solute:Na+ symporter, SSS family
MYITRPPAAMETPGEAGAVTRAAMVVSLVVAPVLLITTDQEWVRLSVMASLSTFTAVAITLVPPAPTPACWRPSIGESSRTASGAITALRLGLDPAIPGRRLAPALKMTGVTAASLFMLLVGTGQILVRSPDRAPLGPLVLALIGLALVRIWWRAAVARH